MQFLRDALRAGVPALQFWEMTPRETLAAIEAAAWRLEHEEERAISQAWHTAALSRARRFPALKSLLKRAKPSEAARKPIAERRQEFQEMKRAWSRDTGKGQHGR